MVSAKCVHIDQLYCTCCTKKSISVLLNVELVILYPVDGEETIGYFTISHSLNQPLQDDRRCYLELRIVQGRSVGSIKPQCMVLIAIAYVFGGVGLLSCLLATLLKMLLTNFYENTIKGRP